MAVISVPQIEALRDKDPQLYEALRKIVEGINRVEDGVNFQRPSPQQVQGGGIAYNLAENNVSSDLNTQANIIATPSSTSPLSYVSSDSVGTSPSVALRVFWNAITFFRPDLSSFQVPASTAMYTGTPAAPTITQAAGGAKAAATVTARVAYVLDSMIIAIGPQASLAVAINNLFTVVAPASLPSWVDGWIPLVSVLPAIAIELPQVDPRTPLAAGVNFVEAAGTARPIATIGATLNAILNTGSVAGTTYNGFAAAVAKGDVAGPLPYNANRVHYPYFDGQLVRWPHGSQSGSDADAALMYGDTHTPLASITGFIMHTQTAVGGGSGSGGGGGCVKKGQLVIPIGGVGAGQEFENFEWVVLEAANGLKLQSTPKQRVMTDEGWKKATSIRQGAWVPTLLGDSKIVRARRVREKGIALHMVVPGSGMYWCNGFQLHNIKPT